MPNIDALARYLFFIRHGMYQLTEPTVAPSLPDPDKSEIWEDPESILRRGDWRPGTYAPITGAEQLQMWVNAAATLQERRQLRSYLGDFLAESLQDLLMVTATGSQTQLSDLLEHLSLMASSSSSSSSLSSLSTSIEEKTKDTEGEQEPRKKSESYADFCRFMDTLRFGVKGYSADSCKPCSSVFFSLPTSPFFAYVGNLNHSLCVGTSWRGAHSSAGRQTRSSSGVLVMQHSNEQPLHELLVLLKLQAVQL
jgi:hypothetical protein